MSDIESRIREAYDSAAMTEGLKGKTLGYIAQQAQHEESRETVVRTTPQEEAKPTRAPRRMPWSRKRRSGGGEAVAQRRFPSRSLGFAIAACLVLAVFGFGGVRAYSTETAYVGIDLNPSLELALNRFDIVVSVTALNEDAQQVLDGLSLEGKSYADAMAELAESEEFSRYLSDDAFMDISVICDDARQSQKLIAASETYIAALPCDGISHGATSEVREEAHSHHMGVGRYEAALILVELDDSLTLEDCSTMSMKELRNRIAAAGGDPSHDGGGQHMGQGHGGGTGNGAGSGSGTGNGQGQGAGAGQGQGTGSGLGQGQGSGQMQGYAQSIEQDQNQAEVQEQTQDPVQEPATDQTQTQTQTHSQDRQHEQDHQQTGNQGHGKNQR